MAGLRKAAHPPLRALPVPLRARPPGERDRRLDPAPAGAPVPERRALVARRLRTARRPRPPRGPGDATGLDGRRLPPAGTLGRSRNGCATAGPVSLRRPTPLDELPLYLREGAAIPFNLRSPDVWQRPLAAERPVQSRPRRLARRAGDRAGQRRARPSTTARSRPRRRPSRDPAAAHAGATRDPGRRARQADSGDGDDRRATRSPRSTSVAALRAQRQGWLVVDAGRRSAAIVLKLAPTRRPRAV